MDYNKEFPDLGYLLGYFPQRWASIYAWSENKPDFRAVIRHFKTHNDNKIILSAIADIKRLLSFSMSEEKLEEALDELTTSGFSPLKTHKEFFENILEILIEPMEETKEHFIPEFNG